MTVMILKLFVPCSSWKNLLEQEDNLSNYARKQFLLISMQISFLLAELSIMNTLPYDIVLVGTLNVFKTSLDKHLEQNFFSAR